MVVLDQFYQIVESETSKVSSFWKVAHTLACIVGAVCGFLTAFAFGKILSEFNYNCVLNANITFDNATILNSTQYHRTARAIDVTMTVWGPSSDCNFAQFTPLVIMISAVIWGVYFAVMSKGGAGYSTDLLSKAWGVIYPCIFFTTIFLIIYIVSTVNLKNGLVEFCDQFKPEFNNTGCIPEINMYGEQYQVINDTRIFNFYRSMYVAVVTSNIGIWAWIFQLVLCITRVCCVADFDVQMVTIATKEEEHVENVIEFTELRDIDEISEV